MRKLVVYSNGQRYLNAQGIAVVPHGAFVIKEYDLTEATHEEVEDIRQNPHNEALLQSIAERGKIK